MRQDLLQVEPETKCGVCEESIEKAIDRHVCSVCELSIHQRCRVVHAESCVETTVRFDKPTKTKKRAKRSDKD